MKTITNILRHIPFLGLLLVLHSDYNWYCNNKDKYYFVYQIIATYVLAGTIAIVINNLQP